VGLRANQEAVEAMSGLAIRVVGTVAAVAVVAVADDERIGGGGAGGHETAESQAGQQQLQHQGAGYGEAD
jgi:hypothetical protein